MLFLKNLKIINVNITNEIEMTQNILITNSSSRKVNPIKTTKILGKSIYPKLITNKNKIGNK